jgi:hypothetical protein
MRLPIAIAAAGAALVLVAQSAHALRPDYDGERGIEVWITPGAGSLFNTGSQQFLSATDPAFGHATNNALSGGMNLTFGAGYRVSPALSVGLHGQWHGYGADPHVSTGGVTYPSTAGGFSAGVYGRLYLMALLRETPATPNVVFNGWGDSRRLDPWVSLGIDYHSVTRRQSNPMRPRTYVEWERGDIGVPITVGMDYRVVAPLAVGLSAGVTPLFGGWITRSDHFLQNGTSGNDVVEVTDYQSGVGVNAAWQLGLNVRYTLSW